VKWNAPLVVATSANGTTHPKAAGRGRPLVAVLDRRGGDDQRRQYDR